MKNKNITGDNLRQIGFPQGRSIGIALRVIEKQYRNNTREEILEVMSNVLASPTDFLEDANLAAIADELIEKPKEVEGPEIALREEAGTYSVYGEEQIEQGARDQMNIAIRLPVAVAGALMPDAHQGYGLPIGGVLATENAVIPYGVGVDIGCRMCLSIFDLPSSLIEKDGRGLYKILTDNTLFGSGREFKNNEEHEVTDRPLFNEIVLLKQLQQKAAKQLGTSGSGNHFVEFGIVEITDANNEFNVLPGNYLSLLSHSGSRGLGANIAQHYTKLAIENCRLPKEAKHLAWLDMNKQEGMEYWLAMNLAGDYASACHHAIHKKIATALGTEPMAMIENHHNFAWKEMLNGKEVIVHRKGATPAGKGVLGIIPGSMSAPGFIVRGKGETASINSASHGAGRKMSRTMAMKTITSGAMKQVLNENNITLIGGGLDEAPHAYKDIHQVMAAQLDLVEVVGKFSPKIVRMDG
ncbi:MAG: RtcB family protein [Bacteroidota bacterium]|nr:RtcB family protein [Bacteroidota bacterium]